MKKKKDAPIRLDAHIRDLFRHRQNQQEEGSDVFYPQQMVQWLVEFMLSMPGLEPDDALRDGITGWAKAQVVAFIITESWAYVDKHRRNPTQYPLPRKAENSLLSKTPRLDS